mgnify:CR=1 FL=1|jgi:hypothetical protein
MQIRPSNAKINNNKQENNNVIKLTEKLSFLDIFLVFPIIYGGRKPSKKGVKTKTVHPYSPKNLMEITVVNSEATNVEKTDINFMFFFTLVLYALRFE